MTAPTAQLALLAAYLAALSIFGELLSVIFVALLAAFGAAVSCRGRQARGLLVILAANAASIPTEIYTARWPWLAFSLAMTALCLIGVALARREG